METEKLKALWQLAFGDSEAFVDLFFSTAYAPDRCRFLTEEGLVTSALYWLDCEWEQQPLAYIYSVATHPAYRGRGLCRCLMEYTHEELKTRGYAGAILMPAEPGLRRMYAKMGYRECSTIREFACEAAQVPVKMERVDRERYASLRKRLLPSGGVIQEEENLAYLETYAELYAGADFLLAAVHEQGSLFGLELLGNAEAAPGILKAMGYPAGTFRTPGKGKPFAMYLPLEEGKTMPTYLGLAFD